MNTKDKGDVTEAVILAALVRLKKTVLVPWGDNKRYDLVVDNDDSFERIQCKTGHIDKGCVEFNTCSCATGRGGDRKSKPYYGQADTFAVYCPDNNKIYLIPVDVCGSNQCRLRLDATLNGNKKNIKWAKDYELVSYAN